MQIKCLLGRKVITVHISFSCALFVTGRFIYLGLDGVTLRSQL
jgi:hypothetical protein